MDRSVSPNYKALWEKAKKELHEAQKLIQNTTFGELIRHGHNLLSRTLRVGNRRHCSQLTIPSPTGKYCPLQLREWTNCDARQQEIYTSVYNYLQSPAGKAPARPHSSVEGLRHIGERLGQISYDGDLRDYERACVEHHVSKIVEQLCMIPEAQEEFGLGHGIDFNRNNGKALDPDGCEDILDQYFIHDANDNTANGPIISMAEYILPQRLSVENLRRGLRPTGNFWDEVVNKKPDEIPTEEPDKSNY